MINGELLAKFDSIHDLPVSEELLGAFVEGGLDVVNTCELKNAIETDFDRYSFDNSTELEHIELVASSDNVEADELDLHHLYEKYFICCDSFDSIGQSLDADTSFDDDFANEDYLN